MTALREFRAAVQAPTTDRLAAARAVVLAAATGSPGQHEQGPGRPQRRAWPRLGIYGAAAAGLAVALLVAATLIFTGGGPVTPPASAAARVLQRAAAAALTQPAPRGSQFIYTETAVILQVPTGSGRTAPRWETGTALQQMWQSVSGSRPGAFGIPHCRVDGRRRSPCQPLIGIPAHAGQPGVSSYAELQKLPTSPRALLSYLEKANRCPPASIGGRTVRFSRADRAWNQIGTILGNNMVVPGRLGQALLRAAAQIPGVTLLHNVADAAGRRGIAVARTASGVLRTELVFAPGSYRFIGVQDVLLKAGRGLPAGTVWAASALVRARVVDRAPATPSRDQYAPSQCGYMPGLYAVGSASSGSAASPSSSSSGPTASAPGS
jgi:hypothetical protein